MMEFVEVRDTPEGVNYEHHAIDGCTLFVVNPFRDVLH
jgi:hypothetical protein